MPNPTEMSSVSNDAKTCARIRPTSTDGSSLSGWVVIFQYLRAHLSFERDRSTSNSRQQSGHRARDPPEGAREQNCPIPAGDERLRTRVERASLVLRPGPKSDARRRSRLLDNSAQWIVWTC